MRLRVWLSVCFLVAWVGCASSMRTDVRSAIDASNAGDAMAAYERMRASEGGDTALLADIAAVVLKAEIVHDTGNRDAAFGQLLSAGTAANAALESLAHDESPLVRAASLEILASRGQTSARNDLRAYLNDADPVVRSHALAALDVVDEANVLAEALAHPTSLVRMKAAQRAATGTVVPELFLALTTVARNDPEVSVRAAAVRALGRAGPTAIETLRDRLSDPAESVRTAAVGALAMADRARAREILGSLLDMGPNAASLEAARVLAMPNGADESGVVDARAFLLRGLAAEDVNLRTQSAVALAGLREDATMNDALLQTMESDGDSSVRILLAGSLLNRASTEARARTLLHALLQTEGATGVQAAALLARDHDRDAMHVLAAATRSPSPVLRRISVRAVARDAMLPDLVRRSLLDADVSVRLAAAGAILSASSASH